MSRAGGARSAAVTFGFVMAGAVMAFGITLSMTHGSGAADAGRLFQLTAILAIATTACTVGADVGLVRTLPALAARRRSDQLRTAVRAAVPPPLIVSLLVALTAGVVALVGLLDQDTGSAILILGTALVAGTILNLCFGVLRGLHKVPWFSFLQNVALPSLRWAGVLVVIWVGTSLPALTLAWCVPVIIVLGLALIVVKRAWPDQEIAEDPDAEGFDKRQFWGFSSARGVTAMIETLLEWIDVLLVGVFLGPVAAGVYGVVNRCVRAGTMLDHTARMVTGPGISAAMAVKDFAATNRIYTVATAVLVAAAWPLYLTLALHGGTVLNLFGEGFDSGHTAMAIVSLSMLFVVSAGGVQSVLLMAGRSLWQLGNKFSALIVAVTLNLLLIPVWGITGAAVAWSAALLTDAGLALWQITTKLGIRPDVGLILRTGALTGGWTLLLGIVTVWFGAGTLTALLIHVTLLAPVVGWVLLRLARRSPATKSA
ncbi:polysaccharide biosynthesis C-terminal domain-containing protein [Kocuria carniphila]|uniref:oligosaccharide flippase family protein n=1 Tax=Kocuria carniphila TaxID=262208 RepID=UPI00101D08FE|nr:polysaccharide biosynthesis C-terminal domain-containing protein [Kocuria carniphila]